MKYPIDNSSKKERMPRENTLFQYFTLQIPSGLGADTPNLIEIAAPAISLIGSP